MKAKASAVSLSVLLLLSMAAAIQPEKATNNSNFKQSQFQQTNPLSQFFDNFLSLTTSQDSVEPGEKISFDATVEAKQDVNDLSNHVSIVEVYRCEVNDPSQYTTPNPCADPNPFIEADREFIPFESGLPKGSGWTWMTEYQTPEKEGTYEAVAYLWNKNTESVVSTKSVTQFTVGEPGEANPNLVGDPSFEVNEEAGLVEGTVTIRNAGDGPMQNTDVLEMQVRPANEGPLSFLSFVGTQDVCDKQYPNNVHKDYSLGIGEERTITLEASAIEIGQEYDVFFLTREGCYPDNEKVEPIYNSFNAGSFMIPQEGGDPVTSPGSGEQGGFGLIPVVAVVLGLVLVTGYFIIRE